MLVAKSSWNIARVDLPAVESATETEQVRYDRAGVEWTTWQTEGIVQKESREAIYHIEERFTTPSRQSGVRRGFIAELALENLGADTVAPHERTFDGPKRDRLLLMRATKANLSQIYALYRDPGSKLRAAFSKVRQRAADMTVAAADGSRRVWVITDPAVIQIAQEVLSCSALTIADGHHRYETALTYRDETRSDSGPAGTDSVMVYLSSMDDPDLTILPYHRVVKLSQHLDMNLFRQHMNDDFELTAAPADKPKQWLREQLELGTPDVFRCGIFTREWGWELAMLRSWNSVSNYIDTSRSEAWRRLDVAVLHEVLLGELVRRATTGGDDPISDTKYSVDLPQAENLVRNGDSDLVVYVRATTADQIASVVQTGDTMPQKSTYFYPKLLTGLVMRSFDTA
jgi:uncharacterized protein (DUF1015 family)